MKTKIARWGNSFAVRLPKSAVERLGLKNGTAIELTSEDGKLLLTPQHTADPELAIVCAISSKRKGYPFELPIPRGHRAKGVVLADQVRNVDWRGRHAEFLCELPAAFVALVAHRVCQLIL